VSNSDVIATMQQVHDLKIDFTLPEDNCNYVKTGSVVQVVLDATNDTVKHTANINCRRATGKHNNA
jgi:membrane fusion protein (multidrug efflux system)